MKRIVAKTGGRPDAAMGQFGRITSLADLPDKTTMLQLVQAAAKLNESGVPARPPAKPRKDPAMPTDLATALKKNRSAAATFKHLSPSHRREYIEWILEAKRAETRQRRLATTLEWLAAGKPRNWKYAGG